MAKFVEVNEYGTPTVINADLISSFYVHDFGKDVYGTQIHFTNGEEMIIEDSYEEMKKVLGISEKIDTGHKDLSGIFH